MVQAYPGHTHMHSCTHAHTHTYAQTHTYKHTFQDEDEFVDNYAVDEVAVNMDIVKQKVRVCVC